MAWIRSNKKGTGGSGGITAVSPLIPKMTSSTTPSGVASASNEYNSDYSAYKAFDGNFTSLWATSSITASGQWIKYDFGEQKRIVAFQYLNRYEENYAVGSFTFQGSNDNNVWTDLHTESDLDVGDCKFVILSNPAAFRYVRWYINSNAHGPTGTGFVELQVYEAA